MRKQAKRLYAVLLTLGATITPAWADTPAQASGAEPESKFPAQASRNLVSSPSAPATSAQRLAVDPPGKAPASVPQAAPKTMGARIASWPVCIAGFTCGAIVGIPICFARKLPDEVHNLAHGFVGSITDNEKKYMLIPAGIAWLPFAGTAALIEAPAYAWKNAYMAEKPFSKEQFSLGQMDAPDKK